MGRPIPTVLGRGAIAWTKGVCTSFDTEEKRAGSVFFQACFWKSSKLLPLEKM